MNYRTMPRAVLTTLVFFIIAWPAVAQVPEPVTSADTMSAADWLLTLERRGVDQPDDFNVLYRVEDQHDARVATFPYSDSFGDLDVYYPSDYSFDEPLPAVVLLPGLPDDALRRFVGAGWRELVKAIDYATLFADSGVAAVLFESGDPLISSRFALQFIEQNAENLHIDTERLGIFSISTQGAVAMHLLSLSNMPLVENIVAFAMMYGNLLMGNRPMNPPAYSPDVYIVQAGADDRSLVGAVDRYIEILADAGLDVTVTTYERSRHNFDTFQDSPETREVIRDAVEFLSAALLQ